MDSSPLPERWNGRYRGEVRRMPYKARELLVPVLKHLGYGLWGAVVEGVKTRGVLPKAVKLTVDLFGRKLRGVARTTRIV